MGGRFGSRFWAADRSRCVLAALLLGAWLTSTGCGSGEPAGPAPPADPQTPPMAGEPAAPEAEPAEPGGATVLLPAHVGRRFTGDLSEMRRRGVVRALVSLNRTDFFLDLGRPRGLQVEALERFERFLNEGLPAGRRRVRVAYVPVPFEDLLPALLEGRGDVAVGLLTITPERQRQVAFASARALNVDEIVVAARGETGLESLEDLAGREVHVVRGSSYAEHLRALARRFRAEGRPPIRIVEADPKFATEDVLEMVNGGVLRLTVADDFRARLWARVMPNIELREDLRVHEGGHVGWAVRPDNPELLAATSEFVGRVKKGTLLGNVLFRRYYENTRWIVDPMSTEQRRRLARYQSLFRKYARRYAFDWRAIAAQALQESGLDHRRVSPAGAVGLMQVLPRTAADPRIAISDILDLENNVHAGVKYLALLRDLYFDDPQLAEDARLAFAWAAYNAGPTAVRRMRTRARDMGLDGDRWFQNVEHAALALVGREPVRYVANVYKYYVAYQLSEGLRRDGAWLAGEAPTGL